MNRAISSSGPVVEQALSTKEMPANLLPKDGYAFLIEDALSPVIADHALSDLRDEIAWRQETAKLFGRKIPLPRLTAWYGSHAYGYSGIQHQPSPFTPVLSDLSLVAERLSGQSLNSVLINLYRDGRDSMGWHSDDEKSLGPEPVIVSLSLGGTRRFQFKHRQSGGLISIDLTHGSCLIMQGRCQACWRHQVPKTKKQVDPRINLTFRNVIDRL